MVLITPLSWTLEELLQKVWYLIIANQLIDNPKIITKRTLSSEMRSLTEIKYHWLTSNTLYEVQLEGSQNEK